MQLSIFKDILKEEIKKTSLTQKEFADKIGIDLSTLTNYLSKKSKVVPNVEILSKMCAELNCDADYLLGRMTTRTHASKDLQKITGLNEQAFNQLKEWNNGDEDNDYKISTLNQILLTDPFEKILMYISYVRSSISEFSIKYENDMNNPEQKFLAALELGDYIDLKEYNASKELSRLFEIMKSSPMEENLMVYDYIDHYYRVFGKHFPTDKFSSSSDVIKQIKKCLANKKPL